MKLSVLFSVLATIAAAAPTPHEGHGKRTDAGTTVDDISEQLYGAWGAIKKRGEAGTTVDDISEQLYGAWGGIKKREEEGTTVDDISEQLYGRWGGISKRH
ncbi:hypothetical protein ETB97_003538 [Aspergillus alliaceus]|uniref:Uncharacterized protein n=1 Tax=Petromyces alliaceus TaxID=209559 RepID=A0A8H6A2Y6_PETAA|nr:hypothetical protein ETB97_003538 [Aspergillus burnettii]